MVAAGLYNPVTGRKMVKTWMADQLFSEVEPHYRHLEKMLEAKFLHPIGIYRPFVDIAEQNDWEGKKTDHAFQPFIQQVSASPLEGFELNDPHGGLHLARSGYLDIPSFLAASRAKLINLDAYEESGFDEDHLQVTPDGFSYEGKKFKKCIFCNGLVANETKYFGWLPFSPVKGELLIGKTSKSISKIYNRGVFILSAGEGKIKVGATYKNSFSDQEPTREGKMELLDKLAQLTKEKFEPTDSLAGIRPATKDRRPFIGKHPEYEHIYMFNGFGSKGVSLIPYFTKHFIEYLNGKTSLNKDVDIERYADLYQA